MRKNLAKIWHRLLFAALLAGGVAIALFTAVQPAYAGAGINQQVNFQGRLLNSQGATVADGYYNLEFKIYQDGDGQSVGDTTGSPAGSLKWTEDWLNTGSTQGVKVQNGFLSVQLGSRTAFGSSVNWNSDTLWLSMQVGNTSNCTITTSFQADCGGDGEMVPMKRLSANAYSLNSALLGGLSSGQFLQLAQGLQTDTSNTTSLAINKTGTGNIIDLQSGGNDAFIINNSGDINFGANANHTVSVVTAGAGIAGKSLALSAGGAGTGGSALAGGNLVLQGGTGGGTNGNGGNVTIDAGVKNGSGTDGTISIGTTTASAVSIAKTGVTTTIGGNVTVASGDVSLTSGNYQINGTTVVDASRNLTNVGTISTSGAINGQTISSSASFTGSVNATSGFKVNGSATTGNFLRGDGTFFVSSAIQAGDIPSGSTYYIQNNNTVQTNANFYIRSAANNKVASVIEGANGQSVDLIDINTYDGSNSSTVTNFDNKGYLHFAKAAAASDAVIAARVSGDTNDRVTVGADGNLQWGPGNAGTDTSLYRNAASSLRTNGSFTADGSLTVSGSGLAITASGTPTASGTSSLMQIGNAIASGNSSANGGTYIGLNAPSSGAGSAADFLNFQLGGTAKLVITNAGSFTTAGTYNGQTISSSANFTGTVNVQGASVTIGHSSGSDQVGSLKLDTASGRMVVLQGIDPTGSGDATVQFPAIAGGGTDTVCLLTSNNCNTVAKASGTQNYVTKWSNAGATQIGNSEIYDNGSGVSIGSTTVTGLFNVGTAAQFHVSSSGAVTSVGIDSGTGLIQGTGGLTVAGTIKLTSLNTAGVLHTDATGQLSTSAVLLGTETSGNYVASLGSLTGLTTSGNSGAGSTPTLSVTYGSGANTAAQGNVTFTCPSGTGNLTGTGNSITIGTGGTCNSLTVVNNPTFSGLITGQANTQGMILSGTPAPGTGITSLLQLGNALSGGNTSTNGGTYFSINEPGSLAGSAADFLNFEWNGNARLSVTSAGALTTASTLTVSSGGITVTGNSTIAGTLSSLTGLTSSGSITFSGLNSTGVVHNSAAGLLSTGAVALGTDTSGNYLAGIGTLTGLTTTTTNGPGASLNLTVRYSDIANSAVQGNTTLVCPSGTGNLTGTGNTITLGDGGTCNSLTVVNNPTFSGLVTANGGLTVANGASNQFTNSSSTLNTADALGSISGSIGSASTTVDIYTAFTINMVATGQTITVPNPTSSTAGRIIYISNIGTQSFTLLGTTINPNASATLIWNGSVWTFGGADGSSILNQNSTDQSANFRISGSGQAATSFLAPLFDTASGVTLNVGTGTATGVSIGKSSTTTTVNGTLQVGSSGVTMTTAGAVTAAGLITGQAGTTALSLTGAPVAGTGITSLIQIGSAISGGNTSSNGGTYIGLNEPSSGSGSAADFLNFQVNGASRIKIANSGVVTLAGSSAGIAVQNATGGSTLSFSNSDGILKVWDSGTSSPTNYARISYSSSTAVFSASSGVTQLGAASGNVSMPLTGVNDRFLFTKTYTPSATYSTNEFVVQRILTGASNSLTGNVLSVEDRSTGSADAASVLYLNENNASASGYIIQAQTSASINQLTLDNSGNLAIAGTVNSATGYQANGVSGANITCSSNQLLLNATVSSGIVTGGSCASGTLLTLDSTDSLVQIGSATADSTQVDLVLDQYNSYSDTGSCNTAGNPNGAMYYNTVSNSVRACIGGGWQDMVSTAGLGIMLFGVVPDSGNDPGDLPSLATNGVTGPCKVSWASTTSVTVAPCTAYSGGRKVIVSSATITITGMTTTNIWEHLCLTGSNNQPALSTAGSSETANMPTFSRTAPILCLADIKGSTGTANNIAQIYDVRTFTNSQKEFVTINATAAGLGQLVMASGSNATQTGTSAAQATVMGVVVATDGGTSNAAAPNGIIVVAGPAYAKASAGTAGQFVQNGTTAGYAQTSGTAAFGDMGISRLSFNSACTSAATCLGSLYFNETIK